MRERGHLFIPDRHHPGRADPRLLGAAVRAGRRAVLPAGGAAAQDARATASPGGPSSRRSRKARRTRCRSRWPAPAPASSSAASPSPAWASCSRRSWSALAQNSLVLALILTAMAGIVLGMGMPTTPAYIVMVALLVPALIKLGAAAPAAHMFAFYFAILSAITPPVALAVFAAASLAKADLWAAGCAAMRVGAAGLHRAVHVRLRADAAADRQGLGRDGRSSSARSSPRPSACICLAGGPVRLPAGRGARRGSACCWSSPRCC